MKKLLKLIPIIVLMFSLSTTVFAEESKKDQFFGVGAIVNAEENHHVVIPKGEREGEGVVHTPSGPFTSTDINYQVSIKGNANVFLKIEETDAKGKFIKEKRSPVLKLTNEWQNFNLEYQLSSVTSQIDVFILTSEKTETSFSFKELKIGKK